MMKTSTRKPKSAAENTFNAVVGSLLERARKARKVTEKQLGAALGISRQQVHFWETGEQRLPIYQAYAIARVLQISVTELLPMLTVHRISADRCAVLKKDC
jgi:transcriptional regulator with XRE-family HTH domain